VAVVIWQQLVPLSRKAKTYEIQFFENLLFERTVVYYATFILSPTHSSGFVAWGGGKNFKRLPIISRGVKFTNLVN